MLNNYTYFYLKLCTFSFEIKESSLSDIQDVWYKMLHHHIAVIKEWREVAWNVFCRTTFLRRHSIGMREKTSQCNQHKQNDCSMLIHTCSLGRLINEFTVILTFTRT